MQSLEKCIDNSINIRLYSVNYQAKPFPSVEDEDEVKIDCTDRISKIFHSDDSLTVVYERHMRVRPDSIMEISVSFSAEHKLLPEFVGIINWEDYDLNAEVLKNLPRFVPNEFARLSVIISQLTSAFEGQPLVTPPSCLIEPTDSDKTNE